MRAIRNLGGSGAEGLPGDATAAKTIIVPPAFVYNGGPLIANISVYPIFYGGYQYKDEVLDLYTQLVSSPYMTWLSEFNQGNYTIGTGSVAGSATIASDPALSGSVKDAAVQDFLLSYVKNNIDKALYSTNLYLPLHYAPSLTIVDSTGGSAWCGYHGSINASSIDPNFLFFTYAVMPDLSSSSYSSCGDTAMSAITATVAHEVAETVTDPWDAVYGWYDNTPKVASTEISDICLGSGANHTFPNGKTYWLENNWSVKDKVCQIFPGAPNTLAPGTIVNSQSNFTLASGSGSSTTGGGLASTSAPGSSASVSATGTSSSTTKSNDAMGAGLNKITALGLVGSVSALVAFLF